MEPLRTFAGEGQNRSLLAKLPPELRAKLLAMRDHRWRPLCRPRARLRAFPWPAPR
jgi:hypothetical protein